VGNRPAENVLPNFSTTAVVPGSWAYEQRGQPNEEAVVIVAVDVKKNQTTKKTRGSDMVAKGMMKVHAAHCASTPVMETSKALE